MPVQVMWPEMNADHLKGLQLGVANAFGVGFVAFGNFFQVG